MPLIKIYVLYIHSGQMSNINFDKGYVKYLPANQLPAVLLD